MRSRLIRTISRHPYAGTFLAGGAVAGGVGYALTRYDEYQRVQRVNRELSSYDEMVLFAQEMITRFEAENSNADSYAIFKALLEAVRLNDVMLAENFLNSLIKSDAVMTEEILDMMIAYAASLSKIGILKLLQNVFGPQDVLRNRRASELLSQAPADQVLLTDILEQFYRGPGYPKRNGVEAFLHARQSELREQILAARQYEPVYTGDVVADAYESYKQIISVRAILMDLDARYKLTRIVSNECTNGVVEFETYLRDVLHAAREANDPVVGTFIFGGNHWFIGQVRVTIDDQKSLAEIIVIDSLGNLSSMNGGTYGMYSSIPHVIFDEVKVRISEDVIQRGRKGCSLIVCDQYGKIMTLDDVMKKNKQYKFAGNQDVLFDYAEHAITSTNRYGVNWIHRSDESICEDVAIYSLFVLPASMLVHKQSVEHRGVVDDAWEVFTPREEGGYVSDYEQGSRFVLGVAGLDEARKMSSPERQAEFTRPANINSAVTVDDEIASSVKPVQSGNVTKRRNHRVDHSGYAIGFFLGKNPKLVLDRLNEEKVSVVEEDRSSPRNRT